VGEQKGKGHQYPALAQIPLSHLLRAEEKHTEREDSEVREGNPRSLKTYHGNSSQPLVQVRWKRGERGSISSADGAAPQDR